MTDGPVAPRVQVLWSKHRVEALTDGIFAVAMTLLVIDLKVPDPHAISSQDQLIRVLLDLAPRAVAWLISFFVLAIFWVSHHRLFHFVRVVDGGLLWRNLFQLAFVAFMPFCASLVGEFGILPVPQVIYNGDMIMLGTLSLLKLRYVRHHPRLTVHPMPDATYHAALLRIGALIAMAITAVCISQTRWTSFATLTYLVMIPIGRVSSRIERRGADPIPTATDDTPHTH